MGKIFCVMGKSASGKDTIYNKILQDDSLMLSRIIPYTTRPIRDGETQDKDYHFCNEEDVKRLSAQGRIIELREYNTVYGVWKYFTVDDGQVDLNSGDRYIVIGTLEAYNAFCRYYGNEHIMPIYIEVDDGIRLERALKREKKQEIPRYEEMCRRFLADAKDFSEENITNCHITKRFFNNTELEDCINEVKVAIRKELMI